MNEMTKHFYWSYICINQFSDVQLKLTIYWLLFLCFPPPPPPLPCLACECNGWSSRCRFNEQLYQERGRGGECMECEGNRDGPNCEKCKDNHFFSPTADALGRTPCEPCLCDPTGTQAHTHARQPSTCVWAYIYIYTHVCVFSLPPPPLLGSLQLQCSPEGQCECKPGVTGPKCDQCQANFWNFRSLGCDNCGCLPEGSVDNKPDCHTEDGNCYCKQNVEGRVTDFFSLSLSSGWLDFLSLFFF